MADYDGRIRVGLELDTKQFKNGASTIEKEYQKIDKAFSKLAKDLTTTGDLSAFKSSAEALTRAFIATNKAMSDLLEKAKSSGKVNLIDYNTTKKGMQGLRDYIGKIVSTIEAKGVDLDVNIDTDLTKELKAIYSELRRSMGGISLDATIVPHVDTRRVSSQLSGVGTDTQQSISTDDALSQIYTDQLRAVEKFNEARRQGLNISQALTQNELALVNAYYNGLKAETRRTQERAKQQKTTSFNSKVDTVVASSVIDLPKEETKIERLNRLAEEVKADFANEAEISHVKAKFGELKRLASEIKIELTYNNNLSTISKQLGTVKKAAEGIRFNFARTGDIEQASKGVDALRNKISELKAQRDSLNDAYENGIVSEIEFRADTADIDRVIDELESETVQIEAEINASSSDSTNLSGIADGLSDKFGKVRMIISATVKAMKRLFEFADYMVGEFEEAVDTAKKFNSALKKVVSTSFDLSRGILAFSHDALDALGITEKLNNTIGSIGFGDLVGADLLAGLIRELSSALKEFSSDALESGSAFQSYYLRISDVFGESKNIIYDYAKTSTNMLGMSENAYMEAASKIGIFAKGYIKDTEDLTNVTVGLTTAIADLSAQTGFTIDDTMTKMLSGIRGNTEAIEELGINVKVADLQTWLDTEGINAKFENLNSTMQNLYRTWYILDKVQSNGTMGYASKMMSTYSGQVRILQAQLNDLKTTIGTYLMQALVPVLKLANMLLSRLIDIANMVGKAFGFLDKYSFADSLGTPDTSGVSEIYDDAIDSISGATTAQEDLTKATENTAKAAKKALAPFHKLNILQKNDSSSSSTPSTPGVGGLGSAIKATPKLDTKPVKTAVSEWLKAFRKAIDDGNWYEVGHLLGKKVNQLVDKLDFKKYTAKFEKGAKSLASIINGFVKTVNFDTLGRKLGDGVNLITNTINTFLNEVDFVEVGKSISEFIRSFMRTVDWEEVGKLWSGWTRILLDILHGFVDDMNKIDLDTNTNGWQELGRSLGKFVNGALDLKWERLGTDIGTAINGISDAVIAFNDTVDFAGIASKLATGFNNLAGAIDGKKIGKSIASVINSAIKSVGAFFSEANFFKLGLEIGNAIGSALANIDWDEAADTVTAIADGIVSLLEGAVYSLSQNYDKIFEGVQAFAKAIVDWINDPDNQDAVAGAINTFVDILVGLVSAIDWDRLYKGIADTLSKIDWADIVYLLHLGDGISLSLKSIFSKEMLSGLVEVGLEFIGELFKKLGKGVRDAIKGLVGTIGIIILGIPAVLAAKVIQIGASIVDGIIKGITGKVSNLRKTVNDFFQKIIDWVKDLFGIHSPSTVFADIGRFLIEGLLEGIKEVWGTITDFFSTAWDGIKTVIETVSSTISTVAKPAWEGIKKVIETVASVISGVAIGAWKGIKTAIGAVASVIKDIAIGAWKGIKSIITSVSRVINDVATKAWNGIKGVIISVSKTIRDVVSTVWGSIKKAVTTVVNAIAKTVSTVWTGIKTTVRDIVVAIKTKVVDVFTALKDRVKSIFHKIKSVVVGVFEGIRDAIKVPINAVLGFIQTLVNGIVGGINTAINALNKFKVNIPDWVPGVGGKKFGFNLPKLNEVAIPQLANGAVIKPNQRFLAELGDQTKGVNIETPLSTMLDAFRGALADGNYGSGGDITIPVYIGSELIDEIIVDANNRETYRNNGR